MSLLSYQSSEFVQMSSFMVKIALKRSKILDPLWWEANGSFTYIEFECKGFVNRDCCDFYLFI